MGSKEEKNKGITAENGGTSGVYPVEKYRLGN